MCSSVGVVVNGTVSRREIACRWAGRRERDGVGGHAWRLHLCGDHVSADCGGSTGHEPGGAHNRHLNWAAAHQDLHSSPCGAGHCTCFYDGSICVMKKAKK
jgi:hypothetical protein